MKEALKNDDCSGTSYYVMTVRGVILKTKTTSASCSGSVTCFWRTETLQCIAVRKMRVQGGKMFCSNATILAMSGDWWVYSDFRGNMNLVTRVFGCI